MEMASADFGLVEMIERLCGIFREGGNDEIGEASELIAENFPHRPIKSSGRSYTKLQCIRVFRRDGYIDRYSGTRLVFPGTLRLLSLLMPEELPYQLHWKMELCHQMYWELYPTIDHVVPVALGGEDIDSNWVTTSQLRNSAKANWTLEALGWERVSGGDIHAWDGLTKWCLDYLERDSKFVDPTSGVMDRGLRSWHRAAIGAESE